MLEPDSDPSPCFMVDPPRWLREVMSRRTLRRLTGQCVIQARRGSVHARLRRGITLAARARPARHGRRGRQGPVETGASTRFVACGQARRRRRPKPTTAMPSATMVELAGSGIGTASTKNEPGGSDAPLNRTAPVMSPLE